MRMTQVSSGFTTTQALISAAAAGALWASADPRSERQAHPDGEAAAGRRRSDDEGPARELSSQAPFWPAAMCTAARTR